VTSVGRRPGRVRAPIALALAAMAVASVALAGCDKESVTPTASGAVAYAAIGANIPNPGQTVAVVSTSTGTTGRPVTVGTLPSGLALVPGDKDLLVTVKAQDQLVEVATSTGKIV